MNHREVERRKPMIFQQNREAKPSTGIRWQLGPDPGAGGSEQPQNGPGPGNRKTRICEYMRTPYVKKNYGVLPIFGVVLRS